MREQKRRIRRQMEAARNEMTQTRREQASSLIGGYAIQLVEQLCKGNEQPTMFSYVPFRSEVDVTPVIQWAWGAGIRVVVPRVDRAAGEMTLHRIDSFRQLVPGEWGISEPTKELPPFDCMEGIHVVLVPGLAFDRAGGRLGYGKGFYDRFVHRYDLLGLNRPVLAGVCFDVQIVDSLPVEQHDLRVRHVISESGILDIP